jgi:hypothetical protein
MDRSEDLDLRDGGGRRHLGEKARGIEPSFGGAGPGRLPELGPFLDTLLDELLDPLELHGRHDRSDVHRLVEWIAHAQPLHALAQLGQQAVVDALLDEQTRTGAAHLALVEPDRVDRALDDAVEVGIFEDDERALAAQLQ